MRASRAATGAVPCARARVSARPRSLPCSTCGQVFLPSGLRFHQKRCAKRWREMLVRRAAPRAAGFRRHARVLAEVVGGWFSAKWTRAFGVSSVEVRSSSRQSWVRQKLIAVLCLDEPRYLIVYLEDRQHREGPDDVAGPYRGS